MPDRIELGDVVRDTVTGFKGVVVGDYLFLHGCRRLSVQPQEMRDGKPIDAVTFDELQLELVSSKRHSAKRDTGGPQNDPKPRPDPTRSQRAETQEGVMSKAPGPAQPSSPNTAGVSVRLDRGPEDHAARSTPIMTVEQRFERETKVLWDGLGAVRDTVRRAESAGDLAMSVAQAVEAQITAIERAAAACWSEKVA